MADHHDIPALIADMGRRARTAAGTLALMPAEAKGAPLRAAAKAIREAASAILQANARDVASGEANGLSPAMLDRLTLDEARIDGIVSGVEAVASLPDPVGQRIDERIRPNGLKLSRIRVPVGVIGIVYESRPNVTVDAAALCAMAGNAAILRGGSEAVHSNRALHAAFVQGWTAAGGPADAVQLVPTTDRAAVGAMLAADGVIDLLIPRGGKSLVARVQAEAKVPVLAHLDGINHVYVDGSADHMTAALIVRDSKMRRTGICGAMETLLIDRAYCHAAELVAALVDTGCTVRGDESIREIVPGLEAATAQDWDTEYLDAIASVALVDGVEGAMAHIAAHGSHHTDAIVARDEAIAERFLAQVDSAIVLWNASTQFADGGEFGLGAEIGIATGRLHARGPVALEGLTTYKWVGRGTGQIRGQNQG